MARLDKTAADYVAIAISPLLIMLMVGSLMYFLVAVFYVGRFEGRIDWILSCYTVAIVLIARISIEEGQERALLFGAALAMAVGFATMRLADAIVLPWVLLAVVWWAADKLTWDCTLIDETEDSSGRGLLQIIGLDRREKRKNVEEPDEPEGMTDRVAAMRDDARPRQKPHRKPHAPGVWIVYFSLAALPLFGLGQGLIPADDWLRRRWAFQLLCVYVGSGLGLLLTTSFLGLRRYLRQRDIKMPEEMAKLWISLGVGLIAVVLLVASLLPRPAAEYAVSQFPLHVTTPERDASPHALGNDGADRNDSDAAPRVEAQSKQDETEKGAPKPGESEQGESEQGESKQGKPKPGESKQGETKQGETKDVEAAEAERGEGERQEPSQENDAEQPSESDAAQTEDARDASDRSRQEPRSTEKAELQEPDAESSDAAEASSKSPVEALKLPRVQLVPGGLMKLIVYAVVLGLLVLGLWLFRHRVMAAIQQFLREWAAFWARLFGGRRQRREKAADAAALKPRARPFSDYADPFASGAVARMTPDGLVRYSFEALEAWAREHDCPRHPDQTPREFAQELGGRVASLSAEVMTLADLFARVAYASGSPSAKQVEPLARLWRGLKSRAADRDSALL